MGRGWEGLKHVFSSGEDGIIYTIAEDGILRWLKHNGFRIGAGLETPGAWEGPKDVGRGWEGLKHVFSGDAGEDGVIYTIGKDGILRWLKHNGFRSGAGLEDSRRMGRAEGRGPRLGGYNSCVCVDAARSVAKAGVNPS